MSTTYWKNLWAALGEAGGAFADLVAAYLKNIVDPLHDDVMKARYVISRYDADEAGIDKALAYIRKLPPVLGYERESFIAYASALQQFIIFGVDAYSARGFVKACVNAEIHAKPGEWEHRIRILCRVISTGRITEEDWMGLSKTGITLPEGVIGEKIAWSNLLPFVHQSLPHMQVED